ncbi:MAG: hypothetical protein ACI9F9_003270, partial [Candidatus Paceibacteria bacterium]
MKVLLATGLCSLALFSGSLGDGPKKSLQKKLVSEFYTIDRSVDPHPEREGEILALLGELKDLTPRETKIWRKELLKRWKKEGPVLEGRGTHYLFEDKRGKYIVGGETKNPKGLAICMHGGGVGSGSAPSAEGAYRDAIGAMGWVGIYP